MFEHTVTYIPVQYQLASTEGAVFKHQMPQSEPDPGSLPNDSNFDHLFRQMGQEGWELVSVQPLLRGQYDRSTNINTSYGLGFSITAGYYFFWKRPKG